MVATRKNLLCNLEDALHMALWVDVVRNFMAVIRSTTGRLATLHLLQRTYSGSYSGGSRVVTQVAAAAPVATQVAAVAVVASQAAVAVVASQAAVTVEAVASQVAAVAEAAVVTEAVDNHKHEVEN